jgi:hypothetical protein
VRSWRAARLVLATALLAAGCAGPGPVAERSLTTPATTGAQVPAPTSARTRAQVPTVPVTAPQPLSPAPGPVPLDTSSVVLVYTALNTQPKVTLPAPSSRGPGVDMDDANSVAQAALKVLWTVNAVVDKSPYAAELRATVFVTPAYAAEIRSTAPLAAPGAQWRAWVVHHVTTTVRLFTEHDSGAPPSTSTTVYLQYGVTVTPHGVHGWKAAPDSYTEFVVVTKWTVSPRWSVSRIETSG